jgi:hypothetical protein
MVIDGQRLVTDIPYPLRLHVGVVVYPRGILYHQDRGAPAMSRSAKARRMEREM